MKIRKLVMSLVAVILFVSCGNGNINNMDGIDIIEQASETGLIAFKNAKGLVGVADSNGEVILNPEFRDVSLQGNFIVAHLSDDEFNSEMMKLARESGINENSRSGDNIKPMKHEYIRGGYGNRYFRLYNSKGKMLKDYCLNPTYGNNKTMKDSIVWKSSANVDPGRDVKQIVGFNGDVTDIDDYRFGGGYFFYLINGDSFMRNPSGEVIKIYGWQPKIHNKLILTRGMASDLKFNILNIFRPDGTDVYIKGWIPCGWIEEPEGDGIFVTAMEGGLFDERSTYVRPRTVFYINGEGEVADLPNGYYLKKDSYYPWNNLMNSAGHQLYGWN